MSSLSIAWREIRTYYASPMAYVVIAAFLGLNGHFFVGGLSSPVPEASMREMLTPATFAIVLWAPIATMRMLAEEQKLGTLELLLTSPIRDWDVVAGKFMGAVGMLLGIIVPTLAHVAILFWFASPDIGPLFTGYLGLLLYGAAAASVGLFTSSLSSNQIVAGVLAAVALLFLTLAGQAAEIVSGTPARVLEAVSLPAHYTDLVAGLLSLDDVLYFVSFAGLFLLLTTLSLESRRWR